MIAATIQCVYACALLLVAEVRAIPRLRVVAKIVASFDFVAVGILAHDGSAYSTWIVTGLVCGAVGDVCLLGAGRRWFTSGLVAFLFGHLAYVVAVAQVVTPGDWIGLGAILPIAVAAVAFAQLRRHLGGMSIPVLVYVGVITTMVIAARASGNPRLAVGAVLFFLSDLAVARQRFVGRSLTNKLIGLPAYYAGQLLIAWSIASA
jgi:uncharacterized membrane protein YhhN